MKKDDMHPDLPSSEGGLQYMLMAVNSVCDILDQLLAVPDMDPAQRLGHQKVQALLVEDGLRISQKLQDLHSASL